MFIFIKVTGNKVYETQVAHMQNVPVHWYVLRFYDLLKLTKSKW